MPDPRLAQVERQILECRADQLAADLAGNHDAAAEHAARSDRMLDYRAALVAELVTIKTGG